MLGNCSPPPPPYPSPWDWASPSARPPPMICLMVTRCMSREVYLQEVGRISTTGFERCQTSNQAEAEAALTSSRSAPWFGRPLAELALTWLVVLIDWLIAKTIWVVCTWKSLLSKNLNHDPRLKKCLQSDDRMKYANEIGDFKSGLRKGKMNMKIEVRCAGLVLGAGGWIDDDHLEKTHPRSIKKSRKKPTPSPSLKLK